MYKQYLTIKRCFMKNLILKTKCFIIAFFLGLPAFFINNLYAQILPIYNVHQVYEFKDLGTFQNRFAVPEKFTARTSTEEEILAPFHYFYEFPDGTYYISENSYVNRVNSGDDVNIFNNSSVVFKSTKIYDEDDDLRLHTGNTLNGTTLPNRTASIENRNSFDLKISHLNNNIVLQEEYVIIVNLPANFKQDILLLFNEEGREIFTNNRLIPPRPPTSNDAPDIVKQIKDNNRYSDHLYFQNPGRNIFVNLKTKNAYSPSEEIKNSNVFKIQAIVIENGDPGVQREMELTLLRNAERAHDPNDILVNPTCIEKNNIPLELDYIVRFQNIGGRNAQNVIVNVAIPDAVDKASINKTTFEYKTNHNIANYSGFPGPAGSALRSSVFFNISNDNIKFTLNGINLEGLRGNENNPDITIGSIKFKLPIINNVPTNKNIECKATITFQDGLEHSPGCVLLCDPDGTYPALEPITTEPAVTTFKKSHSLKLNKIKAGFDYILEDNIPGLFAGIAASPSSCKAKIYNQYELNFSYYNYICNNGTIDSISCNVYVTDSNNNNENREWEVESSTYALGLVPLHLKYDLPNNKASIGIGLELRGLYKTGKFYQINSGTIERNDFLFDASAFADLSFLANNAISYGARYLYGYRYDFSDNSIANQFTNRNRGQLYIQYTF